MNDDQATDRDVDALMGFLYPSFCQRTDQEGVLSIIPLGELNERLELIQKINSHYWEWDDEWDLGNHHFAALSFAPMDRLRRVEQDFIFRDKPPAYEKSLRDLVKLCESTLWFCRASDLNSLRYVQKQAQRCPRFQYQLKQAADQIKPSSRAP